MRQWSGNIDQEARAGRVADAGAVWPRRLDAMIELFQRTVAWLMNRVRVNKVRESVDDGAPVFVKRRRTGAQTVIRLANLFLRLADSGICMFVQARHWTAWEVHCARLLYPGRPEVKVSPDNKAVIIPKVHGASLRVLLRTGDPAVEQAFTLAARELRRVHGLHCSYYAAAWSHGDLHLDNVICDTKADRAAVIDFDTRHELRLDPAQRQSDDLKVVLLELIALANDGWSRPATAFIREYRDPAILAELRRRLVVPRGFAGVLWFARTNCSPNRRTRQRLRELREIIDRLCAS